ncbi:flavodoxin family protein [Aeromicrobium yanjiei]|uniref:Flavodoxin n=1 Tax=Aeromicrobium yanjiei TaxID=2662028 RepID=A0A5Q2MBV2_9ACTN|nr:NAD(P)H-dependent oxidoreductase [Aeromicrobium yanjiei]QGG40574.1 flavodoxin [Aeromicrobium yanjiei]
MTSRFLFLLGSARKDGNTELLARRAAEALPEEVEQQWIHLEEAALPRFVDHRHTGEEIPQPVGVEKELLNATLAATDVVLATPLYWYNVSGSTKVMLDYWAGWLKVPGLDFRARMNGKTLWTIMALGDEDFSTAEPALATLEMTGSYLGMRWGGVLNGYSSAPGQVLEDEAALRRAGTFLAPAHDRAAAPTA